MRSALTGPHRLSGLCFAATLVVASRGGSYAPGTPRESLEYVRNYLRAILGEYMGFAVDFIVPELTAAASTPAMSELIPLAEALLGQGSGGRRDQGKGRRTRIVAA